MVKMIAQQTSNHVAYYKGYKYNSIQRLHDIGNMHGVKRVLIFCLMTAILPTVLIITPLYLRHSIFADVSYAVAESDVVAIMEGISSIFCESQSLKMNTTFNAFQLRKSPALSKKRKHIRLKKSMTLPDDTLEYWGFYLLKGATVYLKVCSRYEGSRILVVRGEKNLNTCGLLEHNFKKFGATMDQDYKQVKVTFEHAQEIDDSRMAGDEAENNAAEDVADYNEDDVGMEVTDNYEDYSLNRKTLNDNLNTDIKNGGVNMRKKNDDLNNNEDNEHSTTSKSIVNENTRTNNEDNEHLTTSRSKVNENRRTNNEDNEQLTTSKSKVNENTRTNNEENEHSTTNKSKANEEMIERNENTNEDNNYSSINKGKMNENNHYSNRRGIISDGDLNLVLNKTTTNEDQHSNNDYLNNRNNFADNDDFVYNEDVNKRKTNEDNDDFIKRVYNEGINNKKTNEYNNDSIEKVYNEGVNKKKTNEDNDTLNMENEGNDLKSRKGNEEEDQNTNKMKLNSNDDEVKPVLDDDVNLQEKSNEGYIPNDLRKVNSFKANVHDINSRKLTLDEEDRAESLNLLPDDDLRQKLVSKRKLKSNEAIPNLRRHSKKHSAKIDKHLHLQRNKRDLNQLNQLDGGIEHGGNAFNYTHAGSNENSVSSFETDLLTCYDGSILLSAGFNPSDSCTEVRYLELGEHIETVHEVVSDGYYYYIFYSDNDFISNDIHAIFDIYKPTYQYANNTKEKECVNVTECTFSIAFWSDETVIVEIPTHDGIEIEEDDIALLVSTCHPRMSVYLFFPIAVIFLILGCSFL